MAGVVAAMGIHAKQVHMCMCSHASDILLCWLPEDALSWLLPCKHAHVTWPVRRQVGVQCAERGRVLYQVWASERLLLRALMSDLGKARWVV